MMGKTKVKLKLLVDTRAKKVLFAEADKQFVDFLFHIMSLPVGTVAKLLNVNGMVGSLGPLYKSIESLNSDFFQENLDKDAVLKPISHVSVPLLSLNETPTTLKFYKCSSRDCYYITDCKGTACHNCGCLMSREVTWIERGSTAGGAAASSSSGAGYVKGVVTYMIMDNLEIMPMNTMSVITMINKFNVKDVSVLVEKEVKLGPKKALALLNASLKTNAVLTNVFLGK